VLEKTGFARVGESLDGDVNMVWRFRLDRSTAAGGLRSSRHETGQ